MFLTFLRFCIIHLIHFILEDKLYLLYIQLNNCFILTNSKNSTCVFLLVLKDQSKHRFPCNTFFFVDHNNTPSSKGRGWGGVFWFSSFDLSECLSKYFSKSFPNSYKYLLEMILSELKYSIFLHIRFKKNLNEGKYYNFFFMNNNINEIRGPQRTIDNKYNNLFSF